MRLVFMVAVVAPALLGPAHGQTSGKTEFEVASIRTNAPEPGFHFAADAVSGGPGTSDPGMFRCSRCTLTTLILKAFNLQPYQFPGRTSLTDTNYEIVAKIPPGASDEEFSAMLQNLLRNRFGLTWHFQEKSMKGYHLVVGKDGPKFKESTGAPLPRTADRNWNGSGESHSHNGAFVFGTSANYRGVNRTAADLARVISDQIGLPVDDKTGLSGKYDISLRWSGNEAAHPGNHADGASYGAAGHGGHDGGGDSGGPTLFDALQQQLGLRLVPAEQTIARLFVIEKVAQRPTEN